MFDRSGGEGGGKGNSSSLIFFILFLFFFCCRSVVKVSSGQITLSNTKSFILMINLLNVTHAIGHSTKECASGNTFLAKSTKSKRKNCRILLQNRIELKTNPSDRKNLLQMLRGNQRIPKIFHKPTAPVLQCMIPPQTAARSQTILVYLHLLIQATTPC